MNQLSEPVGPLQLKPGSPSLAQQSNRPDKLQLLGLAFAAADLAFEVGDDGIITFAMGAANQDIGCRRPRPRRVGLARVCRSE